MITLKLDWREVLWWMQGGMAGSHLRWSVYEDIVNRVWPQASEQERRNMWLIMRRDMGTCWRPDGWNGHSHMQDKGEGPWKPKEEIFDTKPWVLFRQVIARFNPDEQYAVTMRVNNEMELNNTLFHTPKASIISCPTLYKAKGCVPTFDVSSAPLTIRAYRWQDRYFLDGNRYCAEELITNIDKLDIPDDGTM